MALEINGYAVLRNLGSHPETFSEVGEDVSKIAQKLVVKQIRARSTDLNSLRDICNVIGKEALSLILDGMADAQIKTLVAKHDKHHPELKTSNSAWRRRQARLLAEGSVEPAAKATSMAKPRQTKKAVSQKPSEPETLSYASAGARRKR
jgi:hypothetical protein